jgi:starch-binding outer membrane protein, SusD/RagB family
MKSKCFILFCSLVLLCFSRCQKLTEDPKGRITPITYFQSQKDLDRAVAACYECYAHDYGYGYTSRMTICFGSDDLATHYVTASRTSGFRHYDELIGSPYDYDYWQNWTVFWTGIYQANNVIVNYKRVPSPDDMKNGSAAQAYFLRAWAYYMLVRSFGPVPLVPDVADVSVKLPRAPVSDVYASIVSDLQTAINLFPASFTISPDRANPLVAKALLADVYLTMTGWPLNDANKYALAASTANEVIQSGKYTLVPDYATVFTTNNSTESIWDIEFDKSGGTAQRGYGQSSIPDDEAGLDGNQGWDDFFPEINFYKNAPKCKRTNETFYTTFKLRNPDRKTYHLVSWYSDSTDTRHPHYKKFRYGVGVFGDGDGCRETDTSIISMSGNTNKSNDIIRYPIVLLDYAEASAMAAGAPTAEGYNAINLVRTRAGLPDLTPGLSDEQFRDSVVFERAYEFAGENGIRWFDIVRLQMLPQVIAARNTEFNDDYVLRPKENSIPAKYIADPSHAYLAPIPQSDMDLNPTWKQNPGY